MGTFKQAIQVDNNITDIMRLPCVYGCYKIARLGREPMLAYLLNPECDVIGQGPATMGNWLCEDYEGRWHLMTDYSYQRTKELEQ